MSEKLLRHRQAWSGKLFPVHAVIRLADGVIKDRWPLDVYTIMWDYPGVFSVVEKATRIPVRTYNANSWLMLEYEWDDHGQWRAVTKMVEIEVEAADAGKS